jgi:NADH dehydrogenase
MKTIDDALELRGRIFGAFEMAEVAVDDGARREWLTFAVIGGGPTGVEMAGQVAELSRRALKRNFRSIDPATARVLLFDGGDEILAMFGDRLSGKATKELERLGVELHLKSRVTDVTRDGIVVSGPNGEERFACRTKVWAAGVQGSPLGRMLAEASGAQTDRAGRVQVEPDCSLKGHPEVFVVGDLMALDRLPGVAEVAMQSGIHAAQMIKRRIHGDAAAHPFRYRDLGSMATVARFRAIVSFKGIRVAGFIGWLMWAFVHITFLTGFKNRLTALFHWAVTFLGRARDERTITWRQISGRLVAMGMAPAGEDAHVEAPGTAVSSPKPQPPPQSAAS